jgi:hypothetical protein
VPVDGGYVDGRVRESLDLHQWEDAAVVDDSESLSIADAAAECGVSVETFIGWMVESGMLLEHPNGAYVPSPHPDLVRLRDDDE